MKILGIILISIGLLSSISNYILNNSQGMFGSALLAAWGVLLILGRQINYKFNIFTLVGVFLLSVGVYGAVFVKTTTHGHGSSTDASTIVTSFLLGIAALTKGHQLHKKALHSVVMQCPKCRGDLLGIDTAGFIAFETRTQRVKWLLFFCVSGFSGAALLLMFAPESVKNGGLILYCVMSSAFYIKLYSKQLNEIIYECQHCRHKYKGSGLTEFD